MGEIRLKDISTRAPKGWDKDETKNKLTAILTELDELQNLLYAENKHSILIVLQGMDASGKDGLVRDVFSHVNPNGVRVYSFKVPTELELSHDFLWRVHQVTPPKGMIHVFNRSHYEDILVTRVHNMIDDATAIKRIKAINDFENLLANHANTHILKFYLHVSQEEQHDRLEERLKIPRKMWKYNSRDFDESALWDTYMKYYEEAFNACSDIPWHIVPSDQNWYKSYFIAEKLRDLLNGLNMKYPGIKK
ncbi:MAG: polyphosphate kinase [Chitinophagaceae bacterium]|nr:polyphosphate kinase [Chitinophagaceae bacterium]